MDSEIFEKLPPTKLFFRLAIKKDHKHPAQILLIG
jgi:hypothetical protein